jgi:lipopolysaccharide/colanic/teichoic acid biosynthesis glycosyltransferase
MYHNFAKRIIDVAASCLGLLATSPLFLVLPIIIKIESKGPVFHKRKVVGKNGVSFFALKFRTMVKDADTILQNDPDLNKRFLESFKLKRDPRITKVGYILRKFSLDEIPQLINIIKGQMSLVGPRMMTDVELEHYGRHRDFVLSVKPGLTGLWQVSGRQDVSFNRRVELDIAYLKNSSLWKDFVIICKTFRVVFNGEGAY